MHNIKRRKFIKISSLSTAGLSFVSLNSLLGCRDKKRVENQLSPEKLFASFKDPHQRYRPFVRWWWNGDRLEEEEIKRQLRVLKEAGIGGVEINPIRFPDDTDDLDINALDYLGDEWIAHLKTALKAAKANEITCDLIVGSGWPYGGEFLDRDDQIKLMALGTKPVEGEKLYTFSKKDLLDEVSPPIMSPYEDAQKELFSIVLAPQELNDLAECIDLTDQIGHETVRVEVPVGKFQLYYLVKLTGYMAVINGAPGAKGPVLDHYNKAAVERYLNRVSDKLSDKIGFLGDHLRAFFTDSFELEGSNWCDDLYTQFEQRKNYALKPYFPFILFKIGHMGNALEEEYGSTVSPSLKKELEGVRYDFEEVRTQLFKERFIDTYVDWCKQNGVQSRMQAYGRPCNPLEASMSLDIPENETWLGNNVGVEFSDADYRNGRAYSMINKYVSSAAHLADKQLISCEEITNTNMVFNASLNDLKVAGDQSILSGVTHSVLHGFNYSPKRASFPGWIQYGTFLNEQNSWWKFFKNWADYKARLYALFQEMVMQADIAILPPLADLSGKFGFQRDPFPSFAYPEYLFQIWETIHQNGSGCDYVTENIIQKAQVEDGDLIFGTRRYNTLLIVKSEALLPETVSALHKFKSSGGKLIFIETFPETSPGKKRSSEKENVAKQELEKIRPEGKNIVKAPKADFVSWFKEIQHQFDLKPYVQIDNPDKFVSQIYYKSGNKDFFFFCNYNKRDSHVIKAKFGISEKTAWVWNPETGERFLYKAEGNSKNYNIDLGPSASKLIVFDNEKEGEEFKSFGADKKQKSIEVSGSWEIELNPIEGESETLKSDELFDFSKVSKYKNFGGEIRYNHKFSVADPADYEYLCLGDFHGVAEIKINDKQVGTAWYGSPRFPIAELLRKGTNDIQITITTNLGNYVKSLKENKVAQKWTHNQPLYPMGLLGPVKII